MADRSVKVTLSAQVAGYVAAMQEASKATRETGSEAEKLGQHQRSFQQMGLAAMGMGTVAAAGAAFAIKKFADFDEAMSSVQAATHESEKSMTMLGEAAMEAGARTVFSAEESANAIEELAKAGVSTRDILSGGLDGSLDLAAAGGLGVAQAAGIAATALKTFNLEGSDMGHVADLLAAGAGKAMGDVTDLSAALNQSAMVANATGLSIEETTAGLAAFASQGLLGSDAGTSFKSMLQSLTPTSKAAADKMNELGISAYDSQGNFVGLATFAGKLREGLKDLSVEQQQSALKTIFGSDAIRAATVLYAEGEEGIREWTDAVNDQGYAAETARARLDNLKGDLEGLGGALDTALIQTGSSANNVMRDMVQWLTSAVDVYNDLPQPLQDATLGVGLLTAGVGLLSGGVAFGLPKFVEFFDSMNTLGITTKTASEAMSGFGTFLTGPWGVAIIAAATVAGVLLGEKQKMVTNSKELAATLDSETGAVTDNSTAWAANKLEQEGVLAMAQRLGIDAKDMTDAWLGNADALGRVNERLDLFVKNKDFRMDNTDWKGWSGDLRTVQSTLEGSNEMLEQAREKHDRLSEATEGSSEAAGKSAEASKTTAQAFLDEHEQANTLASQLLQLVDAYNELNGVGQSAEQTNARLQTSYEGLQEYVEKAKAGVEGYSTSLDENTVEGSKNRAMLANHASDVEVNAKAQLDLESKTLGATQAAKNYEERLATGRQQIYDTAFALTGSADAAQKLTDKILAMPSEKEIKAMLAGAAEVERQLAELARDRVATIHVRANAPDLNGAASGNGKMGTYANGGIVAYANGGITAFAGGGGVDTGIYSGGAPIHKFAEPETIWEAYISGKPDQRERNRQIWQATGERLGMNSGGQATVYVPTEVTVVDADGRMIGTMRAVANKEIEGYAEEQRAEGRRF